MTRTPVSDYEGDQFGREPACLSAVMPSQRQPKVARSAVARRDQSGA
jgi:hypothetical protein